MMSQDVPRPLLVPLQVDALAVTQTRRIAQPFRRWRPKYERVKTFQNPLDTQREVFNKQQDSGKNGVYVQWRLPEALRRGSAVGEGGEGDDFSWPLIPNRWLVLRRAKDKAHNRAWIVDGDFLDKSKDKATSPFIVHRDGAPEAVYIGRAVDLGPESGATTWNEPRPDDELFLTALGPGLPAFSMYQPYNQNVLSFHDRLTGIAKVDQELVLSYLVLGWVSNPRHDPLTPPMGGYLAEVLARYQWTVTEDLGGEASTLCVGTALGVVWDGAATSGAGRTGSEIPVGDDITVVFGQSWADAKHTLDVRRAAHPEGDPQESAEQLLALNAFYHQTLEHLPTAGARIRTEQEQHRRGFTRTPGGRTWTSRSDAALPGRPAHPGPQDLNEVQRTAEEAARRLDRARRNLFELWWIKGLKDKGHYKGKDFDDTVHSRWKTTWQGELATALKDYRAAAEKLKQAPPEAFTVPVEEFSEVGDPVVLLEGTKVTEPLTGGPLPCRTAARTLPKLNQLKPEDPLPGQAYRTSLPAHARDAATAVLKEFSLLHQAAQPVRQGSTELEKYLKANGDPAGRHTRQWRMPWLPVYLHWQLRCHRIAYHKADKSPCWTFDGTAHRWSGDAGTAIGAREKIAGRSLLTPLPQYAGRRLALRCAEQAATSEQQAAFEELAEVLGNGDQLCQTLSGVNAWFRQRLPVAHVHDPEHGSHPSTEAPQPMAGDSGRTEFTPVRAGQLNFAELALVDAFGRSVEIIHGGINGNVKSRKIICSPTTSLTSDTVLDKEDHDRDTVAELPPRIIHPTRLRFDGLDPATDLPPLGDPANPVRGWLQVNRLDRTLLVYAPGGMPFGQVQINQQGAGNARTLAWRALPPRPPAETWEQAGPHLPRPLRLLLDPFLARSPSLSVSDFEDLLRLIDDRLTDLDRKDGEDDNAAVLAGRPIAVVRAGLRLQMDGAPPTGAKESFGKEGDRKLSDCVWSLRLGEADLPEDGLIGYCNEEDTTTVWAPEAYTNWLPGPASYVRRVRDTDPDSQDPGLRVTASPCDEAPSAKNTHRVTLLMDPWRSVQVVSGILPVVRLRLDEEHIRPALTRLKVPFALGPILARIRPPAPGQTVFEVVMPCPSGWTGTWEWTQPPHADGRSWQPHTITPATADADLTPERPVARAGFLRNVRDYLPQTAENEPENEPDTAPGATPAAQS
ncbi:hypothetical protein [Streptomyces huiliensis]|uniref:hypothetical protein n=1 Tax=Streptomyces huiliensis TaxID=2876027 RepID=UPI001CC09E37|nr:hypothetical protein [Streptomyces huiliensis]MBZ4319458.1 hypothetical protein [Streptomyces huiliensis]